jgi:N-acetylglucosamine-6-phosphate deacetylase
VGTLENGKEASFLLLSQKDLSLKSIVFQGKEVLPNA